MNLNLCIWESEDFSESPFHSSSYVHHPIDVWLLWPVPKDLFRTFVIAKAYQRKLISLVGFCLIKLVNIFAFIKVHITVNASFLQSQLEVLAFRRLAPWMVINLWKCYVWSSLRELVIIVDFYCMWLAIFCEHNNFSFHCYVIVGSFWRYFTSLN